MVIKTVHLDATILTVADKLVEMGLYRSRSELMRVAIRRLILDESERWNDIENYVRKLGIRGLEANEIPSK